MKKIISIITAFILICAFSLTAIAHTGSLGVSNISNDKGWEIYDNSVHWKSYNTSMTVNRGDFTSTSTFGKEISNAVTSWDDATFNGSDLLSMSISTSGSVIFKSKSAAQIKEIIGSSTAWGFVYRTNATKDSTNSTHYSTAAGSVEIWINWADVLVNKTVGCSTHTALHELGHVIGLKDIPSTVSYNDYLMCNEFGANYSVPKAITETDKKGAAVILGLHTSHTFTNNVCTKCGGKKV